MVVTPPHQIAYSTNAVHQRGVCIWCYRNIHDKGRFFLRRWGIISTIDRNKPIPQIFPMNSRIRLNRIINPPLTLHFSPGYDARAHIVGSLVNAAYRWLSEWLNVEMPFTLSILRRENWEVMRQVPYGYPHSNSSRMTIFVPARYPPRLITRLSSLVEAATPDLQADVLKDFPTVDASIFRFLDMVAVHELGHLFITTLQLELGAKWLTEFVADLFATAYFAENTPTYLSFWLAWARLQTAQSVPYTSLADYETLQGKLDFVNANFYQGQFNLWASEVWQREGQSVAPRLIDSFSHQPEVLKRRLEGVIGAVGWL